MLGRRGVFDEYFYRYNTMDHSQGMTEGSERILEQCIRFAFVMGTLQLLTRFLDNGTRQLPSYEGYDGI